MSDDKLLELFRQHRTLQEKYAYFLLALAGSAIALAVNQTQGRSIEWQLVPLGGAVLCWAASFYCGCSFIEYVGSTTLANYELFRLSNGTHPDAPSHPELVKAAAEGLQEAIKINASRAARFSSWQTRLLIYGMLLYVCWHVLEMYLRTV